MPQRACSSSRAPNEFTVVSFTRELSLNYSPRRRTDSSGRDGILPLHDPNSVIGKRDTSRSRLSDKWIHAIPVVVFLCHFILWTFSNPVIVVIENGRISAIHPVQTPFLREDVGINITILAATTSSAALSTSKASQPANLTRADKDSVLL